jgi:hypothetical protein
MSAGPVSCVQIAPSQSGEVRELSADAGSYVDLPLPVLQNRVPTLRGLVASEDHEPVKRSSILTHVGAVIESQVPQLPDLISSETVHISRSASILLSPQSLQQTQLRQLPGNEFNYLLLHHPNADGSATLEEYRSDLKNRRVDLSDRQQGFPSSYGFAYAWLLFLPAIQGQSRFSYLGQQKVKGRETFVMAFAQVPDLVKNPCQFTVGEKPFSFFYQGIAWIDQSTFRIVMLHTDLLRPLPEARLARLTADVLLKMVQLRGIDLSLWLPSEVFIISEAGNRSLAELHEYSNYRLYHAKTKVVIAP